MTIDVNMTHEFSRLTIEELHDKLDHLQHDDDEAIRKDQLKRLLHELQVHQIELEMQNRELKESQSELEQSRDRYADLYDFAPVGFLTLDSNGLIRELNLTAATYLGHPRSLLLKTPFNNLIAAGQTRQLQDYFGQVLSAPDQRKIVTELTLNNQPDGPETVRLESILFVEQSTNRQVIRVAMLDVSEQKKAREVLDDRLRQAAKIFDSTLEGIVITDKEFSITAVNRAFTRLTGYQEAAIIGKDFRQYQINQDDCLFYQKCWDSLRKFGRWQGEMVNKRINDEYFTAVESISSVFDNDGRLTNYVIVLSDITHIKESQKQLNFLAYHDTLTDLPNRLLFNVKLEHSVQRAKRHQYEFALLFLDLDRFKNINDTMGHKVGDSLLKVISERLTMNLREEDTVARLGGDEFIILLEKISHPEDAAVLAEKLIDSIVQPISIGGRDIVISTSIGISVYPNDADNAEDLVKAADTAMYHAKHCGKRTFRFYSPKLTARALEHLSIEHGLHEALLHNELAISYQPIVSMGSGETVGVEALIRWNHPQRGLLMPDTFIPIAEETGSICKIGTWVIRQVCQQISTWRLGGVTFPTVAINVSVKQIIIGDLAGDLMKICEEEGLKLQDLDIELEITESVLQEVAANIDTLNQLHAIGVRLAVDDFGTGYSSLSKLKHFPIDTLKIDRSFVQELPDDLEVRAIVTAIIALAHTMKLKVIAEGVESDAQHNYLQDLGCDFAQGFYFNKPLKGEEITRLYSR